MPPASTQSNNNEAYSMILAAISEVKAIVSGLDERVRQLERATVEQSVTAAQKLDALFRRVDEHSAQIREVENEVMCRVRDWQAVTDKLDERLTALSQRIQEVEGVARLSKFIGAAFGGLIIALIWGILTHTVIIGVP